MSKIVFRILSISFTVLVCILVVCGLYRIGQDCYEFGYRVYTEPPVAEGKGQDVLVQVRDDMDLKALSALLEEKGLIRDANLFWLQAKLCGFKEQEGIYTLNTSMTAREMVEALKPVEEEQEEAEE